MSDPSTMVVAIVLTAIEEALSRATMVQRDKYLRRRSGKGDYTPEELDIQYAVWTMQIGNSMIIEVCVPSSSTRCASCSFFLTASCSTWVTANSRRPGWRCLP